MGRGSGSAAVATVVEQVGELDALSDHQLVARVRGGDDRAFEALYERYHRRIGAYVLGLVRDHGRAEDVTQEVFVSALRRMRATERPIAFKPWIYEIAKNGCIDAFRRARRAEEVSIEAEDRLNPADRSRLADSDGAPDDAVATKEELETLCGAFGGLSSTHHRILVLRELEGRSYNEIGELMGMTRPAVESTLFRARRRITEEYEQLASGERCVQVQEIIATAADGVVGRRDARRLSRHLAHCRPCRRDAIAAGLDRGLVVRRPARERFADRIAAWLPLPAFLRARRAGDDNLGPRGSSFVMHLPALSDQLSSGWAKVLAAAALVVAGAGVGVATHSGPAIADKGSAPLATPAAPGAQRGESARHQAAAAGWSSVRRSARGHTARQHPARAVRAGRIRGGSTESAGVPAPAAGSGVHRAADSRPASASTPAAGTGRSGGVSLPGVSVPSAAAPAVRTADQVRRTAGGAVQQAAGAVQRAAGTVQQAAGTAQQAAGSVQQAASGATTQVQSVAQQAAGALPPLK